MPVHREHGPLVALPHAVGQLILQPAHVHTDQHKTGAARRGFTRSSEPEAQEAADHLEFVPPRLSEVDAVVLGGDQRALAVLRTDPRLAGVFARAGDRVLEVGEPRRVTLDEAAERARMVEIVVRDAG